jgi:hypothetical protein
MATEARCNLCAPIRVHGRGADRNGTCLENSCDADSCGALSQDVCSFLLRSVVMPISGYVSDAMLVAAGFCKI